MRRAFSEPSIGSITTRGAGSGSPNATSPRSSEMATKSGGRPRAVRSSSAKTTSSQRRSMTSVRSPPSPTPSYSVRAAIPRDLVEDLSLPRRPSAGRRRARPRRRRSVPLRCPPPRSAAGARLVTATALANVRDGARSRDLDPPLTDGSAPGGRASRRPAPRPRPAPGPARAPRSPRGSSRSPRRGRPRAGPRPRPLARRRGRPPRADRDRLIAGAYEELWVGTYESIAERLLREHAVEAGLDPFFETVSAADRLALLLDRLDDLPLRRHEIRGNPGGLLARLLQRIDCVKSEAVTPAVAAQLGGRARARRRATATSASSARREIEFADLYAQPRPGPARVRAASTPATS